MSPWPRHLPVLPAICVVAWAITSLPAVAQDEETAPEPEFEALDVDTAEADGDAAADESASGPMEEIIVVAPKPGSRRDVDTEYEDPVRAKLLKDFYRSKELEEEYQWRSAADHDPSSRIKWGYDPRDDYRMRNDSALQDLSWEKNKPATVFKFEF